MRVRVDAHLAFASDRGTHRVENQDDILIYEPRDDAEYERRGRLVALADGIGGGTAGGEASRAALRGFLSGWLDYAGDRLDDGLSAAFDAAQGALDTAVQQNRRLKGMGTTLTAFVQRGSELRGVHVGDSRCLAVQDGDGRWLTSLHTSPLDANRLTRALVGGQPSESPAEFFGAELGPGDRVLLMSDGLWRAIPEAEGLATIHSVTLDDAVPTLLLRARSIDGSDNASFVMLEYRGSETSPDEEDPAWRPGRDAGEVHEIRMPETGPDLEAARGPGVLARSWPWVLLVLGAALAAAAFWLRAT